MPSNQGAPYIMLPGGRLSIGPHGQPMESLGASFDDKVVFDMLKNLRKVPIGELEALRAQMSHAEDAEFLDSKKRDFLRSKIVLIDNEMQRRSVEGAGLNMTYLAVGAAAAIGLWLFTRKKGK